MILSGGAFSCFPVVKIFFKKRAFRGLDKTVIR